MAFVHGKKAVFKIDNSAGTPTDISAFCEEVSLSRSIETAETTTFGNDSKTYITGLTDATVSLSGKFDAANASAVDAVLTGILGSASTVSWAYRTSSASTSTSNPEYQGEGILTSYEVAATVGDAVTFSAELQVSGAVTRATA
jgi:TP901-1 family phage major tail protein